MLKRCWKSQVRFEEIIVVSKVILRAAIPVLGKYKGRFEKTFVNIVQSAASRKNKKL
jgi:hypothetical protein